MCLVEISKGYSLADLSGHQEKDENLTLRAVRLLEPLRKCLPPIQIDKLVLTVFKDVMGLDFQAVCDKVRNEQLDLKWFNEIKQGGIDDQQNFNMVENGPRAEQQACARTSIPRIA